MIEMELSGGIRLDTKAFALVEYLRQAKLLTEAIQGHPGTCDTHEELKQRALAATAGAAVPHRPRAGTGSLDPRA